MSRKNKSFSLPSKILALIMSLAMIFTALPLTLAASAADETLVLPSISDIHYVAEANRGNYNDAYIAFTKSGNRSSTQMDGLLDSALAAVADHAEAQNIKYLLIPGDLSSNGELSNHEALASRLLRFERETGIQVIVTNGNHDINNYDANTFAYGFEQQTVPTTPEQFKQIYKNLGWDLAYHTYTPATGKAGMLSYSVKLDGGYRLIVMDGGKYSRDNTEKGLDSHETAGNFSEGLLEWIKAECADAAAAGETVLGMTHWNITEMSFLSARVLQGFIIDNDVVVADTLADAGMHWVFTGHSHSSDVSYSYSDAGEPIYSIMTSSIGEFPNTFRESSFTKQADGSVKADLNTFDCDCVLPVKDAKGFYYPAPYRVTTSFKSQYGDLDLAQYVDGLVAGLIGNTLIPGVKTNGGLVPFIENSLDISLRDTINGLIGGGLTIAGIAIFDAKNIMNLINDIALQLETKYLQSPEALTQILDTMVTNLADVRVSEVPCTKFIDTYGFGDASKGGTFADVVYSMFAYSYVGNEDISDDAFMQDVLAHFEDGSLVQTLIDALKEYVVHGVVMDELLGSIEINLETVLGLDSSSSLGGWINQGVKMVLGMLGSDKTAKGIINMLLDKGIVKQYGYSVDGIIDNLLESYGTDALLRGLGHSFIDVIGSMVTDENPDKFGDNNVSYTYSGPVEVEATTANYRLPTMVAVTFGENTKSQATVNWYTRYSVTGTDIVITDENGSPVDAETDSECIETVRQYPGVDFGVLGILNYEFPMQRHIVKISGLEKGTTYLYKVGDASKGWWSETGTITTADGSDKVSFIHTGDCQASCPGDYQVWNDLLTAAENVCDYDFIVNTGDIVDHGDNVKQWQWALDTASEHIMNTYLAPASGNHEEKGTGATVTNFTIANAPEQDTVTGIYYSFDYNNVHFAVLNSNDLGDNDALSQTQIDWLTDDMKSSSARWKFVALHKAVYSNGNHFADDDVVAIRAQLASLMPSLGIDIVFQGHDHVYLRTDSMVNNTVVTYQKGVADYNDEYYSTMVDPSGTVYVISGAAGTKSYDEAGKTDSYFPKAASTYTTSLPVFSSVDIDGDMLFFNAYVVDGTDAKSIDRFAIKKSFMLGDVNSDGRITTADVKLALRYIAHLENLGGSQIKAADINGDGVVTTVDAKKILRYVAGFEKF